MGILQYRACLILDRGRPALERPGVVVRVAGLIALLCLVASCVVDDEGQRTAPLATWTISGVPSLVIDSHANESFYDVRGVAISSERVAVADAGNYAVAIFDSAGQYLHTLGRRGRGPGEFESVSDVFFMAGDSVMTFDGQLSRFQVFDASGRYVRGFTFSTRDDDYGVWPVALLSSGVIIGRKLRPDTILAERSGVTRATAEVMRFAMDGRVLDTVAIVPSREAFNTQFISNVPIPFGHSTLMDGAGDLFVLASSDSNALSMYSANGSLLHTVREVAPPGPAVETEEIDSLKERILRRSSAAMQHELGVVYDEMPYPETKPPFSWVYAGADSSVWLRVPRAAPGEDTFMIFDWRGEAVAMAKLPPELNPMEVTRESIVGVWTDSLGVESVRIFGVSADELER